MRMMTLRERDIYAMRDDDVKVKAHEGDQNNRMNLGVHDQVCL